MSEQLPVLAADAPAPHPIHLVVTDDLRRSRLTVFFRLLLAIPHLIWLALWGIAVLFAVIAAWFVGIFTGGSRTGCTASSPRTCATDPRQRVLLDRRQPVPRRSAAHAGYPVDVEIAPPREAEPADDLLPAPARDPGLIVALRARLVAELVAFVAWFCALFTGTLHAGCATCSPTASATTRRRTATSAS